MARFDVLRGLFESWLLLLHSAIWNYSWVVLIPSLIPTILPSPSPFHPTVSPSYLLPPIFILPFLHFCFPLCLFGQPSLLIVPLSFSLVSSRLHLFYCVLRCPFFTSLSTTSLISVMHENLWLQTHYTGSGILTIFVFFLIEFDWMLGLTPSPHSFFISNHSNRRLTSESKQEILEHFTSQFHQLTVTIRNGGVTSL